MGVTSCLKICSKDDNELQTTFSVGKRSEQNNIKKENNFKEENNNYFINNDDNLYNIKETKLKENNSYQEFIKKFEKKLPGFGEYIDKEEFNKNIPENALQFMAQNEFKFPDDIRLNENIFQMNPVKFKNDNIYEGSWNENIIMDGIGKYYIKEGNIFIEGIWDNGKSIYGRIYYPNNNIYEGYINNSNCHGKGKIFFNTGEIYEGDFNDGEIDGNGKFTFADKTTYEGEFNKGEFNGNGIIKWPTGIIYEGEFSKNVLNNHGKLIGKDGEQYEGNFENNYFNGKGKYTFDDGSTYEGEFESGLRNGKGIYIKKDDFSYEGSWANDYPHGFGTFILGDINIKGIWRNGFNADITKIEGCLIDEFNHDKLNFKIPEVNLKTEKLSNLSNMNNIKNFTSSNNPSYLNSRENDQ